MTLRRLTCALALVLPFAAAPAVAQSPWPAPQQQQQSAPWPSNAPAQQSQPAPAPRSVWGDPSPSGPPQQMQPAPQAAPQSSPQSAPWGQTAAQPPEASPFDAPQGAPGLGQLGQQQQQIPPCLQKFIPLRDDAQKKAAAIQAASKRKATPQEACGLFNAFVTSESKALKYAETNQASCSIPAQAIEQMRAGHKQALEIRGRVCAAAKSHAQAPRGPTLGEALGTSQAPSASNVKSGRGTFDTLTGTPLGGAR